MKVLIVSDEAPAHLHMESQCELDAVVLKSLVARCEIMGFGRDPDSDEVFHVQVPLRLRDE